ncbi:MAG: leucine-rich repeat protein [Bullifex sp.]|nr:leucine-rich repeat protein [Bullifex sp.]
MKKTFSIITIIALLFSLIGCNSDNAPMTGSITVSIKDSVSRTITSEVSPVAVKYAVEGTAPDGTKVSFDLSESAPSWIKAEAAPGDWSFTATAYNKDDTAIGSGTASATVVPGQSTSVTIEVYEYSGEGTLTVNLTGITSDLVTYTATVYKVLFGSLYSVASEVLTDGSITFTLPNGFYSLVLTCDNSSIVMPAAEAVRIMKGDNLSASYSICDQGGVNVVISNGIKPYPEMSVTLDKTSVAVGEEVTATATIQEKDSDGSIIQGSYSYEWYVNNVKLESVDESEATITFDDEGLYNITCIAFNAETGVVWSKVAEVNVVSTVNRVSFYSGNRLIESRTYTPDSSEVFPTLELGEGFTLSGWKAEGSNTLITDESFSLPYSENEYKYYAYIDTELLGINITGAVYGTDVLKNSSTITEVAIPDSIRGKAATSIGYEAFRNFSQLTKISIPDSVTFIGNSAFYKCSSLTGINIPDSVTSIGEYAFGGCYNLTSITIPDSVTYIKNNAFAGCRSLTSITIPDSVTSIGSAAFGGCSSLTEITILEGVTSIGRSAFGDCGSLTSITIPDSVTSIGSDAFVNCTSLTSIIIPESVTSIRNGVFGNCSSLTSITIGNSITSIGGKAFADCSSLTSITIPDSVTSIEYSAFWGCSSLTGINVSDDNNNYVSIGGVLFDENVETIIFYPCGKSSNYYAIPDSVTSIGNGAFWDCTSLTSVTIGNSVTSIGEWAFCNCSSLTSINIPDSVTSIGEGAFVDCSSLTSITIPDSVTSIGSSAFFDCSSLSEIRINRPKDSVSGAPWGGNKTGGGKKALSVIWSDSTIFYK